MAYFRQIIIWISSLKVAIILLLIIALASALGTFIPQNQSVEVYLDSFNETPWLGLIDGKTLLYLQLNHIYSSIWFIGLLIWLGLSLIICSWRRQWPTLKAAMRWDDYKHPRQLVKLSLVEEIHSEDVNLSLQKLSTHLEKCNWKIKNKEDRFSARKGLIGRTGPPLVHIGLILLMIGATFGNLGGVSIEEFLTPGKSLELLNPAGEEQIIFTLKQFLIDRDPAGRTEQFTSEFTIKESTNKKELNTQISVNHPMRYKGMTLYQADWGLDSIILKLGESPEIRLPLKNFPELGDQIWGIVLPTKEDGSEPILLSLSSELGPIKAFNQNGDLIANLYLGQEMSNVNGIPLKVTKIIPTSGVLLKRDPGVPIVYSGFAITLLGGFLSLIATKQLWVIIDSSKNSIFIGGLSNRDLTGLAQEIPTFSKVISTKRQPI